MDKKYRLLNTPNENNNKISKEVEISYRRALHLQCRVAAHLGHIFFCKNDEVLKPLPLENAIFEKNLK